MGRSNISLLCFISSEPFINIKQGNEVAKLPNKKSFAGVRGGTAEMIEWLITDLGSVVFFSPMQ